MGVTSSGFDNHHEMALAPTDSDAESGTGGGAMPIWTADRWTKLNRLVQPVDSYTHNSSYPPIKGVVGSGWDRQGQTHERSMGILSKGNATSDVGELAGKAGFYYIPTGSIIFTKDVSGQFTLFLAPPDGITDGVDSETPIVPGDLGVHFQPTFGGFAYEEPDLSKFHEVSYSGVEGTVLDAGGQPVQGATLIGNADSANTDRNGDYSVLAPVGVQGEIAGLKRSLVKTFTAPEGQKETVDWEFAGIIVRVMTPDFEPIPGAPVEIEGEVFETDYNGEVAYNEAALDTEHTIRVFDSDVYEDTVVSPSVEGRQTSVRVGADPAEFGENPEGTGPYPVSFEIVDQATGRAVRNTSIEAPNHDIRTSTNPQGETKLVIPTDEDGVVKFQIAGESKRYRTRVIEPELTLGATTHVEVALRPRRFITQA